MVSLTYSSGDLSKRSPPKFKPYKTPRNFPVMGKFRVPSWLQTSSASTGSSDIEKKKKQNRRSLSFAPQNRAKQEAKPVDETGVEPKVPETEISHLIALARKISAESDKLESYIKKEGLPQPGFEVDSPDDFPKLPGDIQKSRQEIVYASKELANLVRGPRELVRWSVWSVRICSYPA